MDSKVGKWGEDEANRRALKREVELNLRHVIYVLMGTTGEKAEFYF